MLIGYGYHSHKSSSRAYPRLEHRCLHKSAPRISACARCQAEWRPMLHGFRSASTVRVQICAGRPLLLSLIPWRVVDSGMKSTAMIYFRPARAIWPNKRQRWTTCATPHFCVGHMLTVMNTIGQRHPSTLTLPLSLSRSLLHTKRQAGHIRSKGEAWWTRIYWSARCC